MRRGGDDILIPVAAMTPFACRMIGAMGAPAPIAEEVGRHLVEADLMGVYSHGCVRLAQYADWLSQGMFDPSGSARILKVPGARTIIDGGDGFGVPAMRLAVEAGLEEAITGPGVSAIGVRNTGHTGRLGAFVEQAAENNCFCMIFGGGTGPGWPQVVPHGGAKGRLPTNPYAIGLPGGAHGPVVLDFATATGSGGKVYAAQYAGHRLAPGLCVDATGAPTTNPQDYFDGGALLPMAGAKGYGMALVAELIGGALLGEARSGMNWIVLAVHMAGFQTPELYRTLAEDILARIRDCPPAPGFDGVEIPGERERETLARHRETGLPIPAQTLASIRDWAEKLGVDTREIDHASEQPLPRAPAKHRV
ncbi:MAG: Ldh family oxidoreductase [Pseudomonadota bacterium]